MIRELKGNHGGELSPSGSYWANYYSSVPLDTAGSLNVFFFSGKEDNAGGQQNDCYRCEICS